MDAARELPDVAERWKRRLSLKAFFGPPRRSRSAQFVAPVLGLLLMVSLATEALIDAHPDSAWRLGIAGCVLAMFTELLDPQLHRYAVGLRVAAVATVVLALVLMFG